MNPRVTLASLVVVAPLLCGCGDSGPKLVRVRGEVTYQGKPVSKGTVNFNPVDSGKTARPGTAMVREDGSYEAVAYPSRTGILPGEYEISVLSYNGTFLEGNVEYLVPERFSDSKASGLRISVAADGVDEIRHDLHLE